MAIFQGLIGIVGLIAFAWAISENRRAFPWRTAAVGLVVQVLLALLLIKLPGSQIVFVWIGKAVGAFVQAANRLGVSERSVRQLAGEGRVRGATKAGAEWLIPTPVELVPGRRGPVGVAGRAGGARD